MYNLEELKSMWRCTFEDGSVPLNEGENNKVGGLIDLVSENHVKTVLEIGSFNGVSTNLFCLLCNFVVSIEPKMKLNLYLTKDYENEPRLCPPAKQTQSKPIYVRADRTNKYLFFGFTGIYFRKSLW